MCPRASSLLRPDISLPCRTVVLTLSPLHGCPALSDMRRHSPTPEEDRRRASKRRRRIPTSPLRASPASSSAAAVSSRLGKGWNSCPHCGNPNLKRRGKRVKKYEVVQLWQ